ncbi:MAG: hypothetical protein IH991_15130 [Planctomycetes bacterium]|nr:hypothetical protein [Planctomycetota bacterium]
MKELREKNDLVVIGVTQEQHPDRCRLFAQWQQFDWPILHDPINLLKLRAVPVVIAIDEHGIVRNTRPQHSFLEDFIAKHFEAPSDPIPALKVVRPDIGALEARAKASKSFQAWRELGDAAILWGGAKHLDLTVEAYQTAVQLKPNDAASRFRLGVAHRMRYESKLRRDDDFARAVAEWGKALEIDPNQYIYRRRIEQYGPRLIKPYPFYDWIERAKREVKSRGETPIPLATEPSGAEIAQPSRMFPTSKTVVASPDPDGRINRDADRLIRISPVVVPSRIRRGGAARIHVSFRPLTKQAHWNNESEPLRVWIESPAEWTIEKRLLESPQPKKPESREERSIEFEVRAPRGTDENATLKGYALYFVCEEAGGKCLYLRQDFTVEIRVVE